MRERVLIALLVVSAGLNVAVGIRWWHARNTGTMAEVKRISRTQAMATMHTMLPVDTSDIVLLGDSHFEHFPAQEMLRIRVLNRGLSGESSAAIKGRIPHILQGRPRTLVLMAGSNDIFQGRDEEAYVKDMAGMLDLCTVHDVHVVVVSIPPNAMPAIQEQVERLNARLHALCKERGVPYVDLDPMLMRDGLLDPALTYDGLHLNGTGYKVLAEALRPHLE